MQALEEAAQLFPDLPDTYVLLHVACGMVACGMVACGMVACGMVAWLHVAWLHVAWLHVAWLYVACCMWHGCVSSVRLCALPVALCACVRARALIVWA